MKGMFWNSLKACEGQAVLKKKKDYKTKPKINPYFRLISFKNRFACVLSLVFRKGLGENSHPQLKQNDHSAAHISSL